MAIINSLQIYFVSFKWILVNKSWVDLQAISQSLIAQVGAKQKKQTLGNSPNNAIF